MTSPQAKHPNGKLFEGSLGARDTARPGEHELCDDDVLCRSVQRGNLLVVECDTPDVRRDLLHVGDVRNEHIRYKDRFDAHNLHGPSSRKSPASDYLGSSVDSDSKISRSVDKWESEVAYLAAACAALEA